VPARIRVSKNFSDASFQRLHSVSGLCINHIMSPSYAFDLWVASELSSTYRSSLLFQLFSCDVFTN